ncbi:MAG: N-acetyltransferase [Bacteroidota bacterium]
MPTTIRPIVKEDMDALKNVLGTIELFPPEMLDNMTADYFNQPDSQDIWFAAVQENKPVALAFCAPEKLTEGTFNLYAIGVERAQQSKGIGQQMMHYLEERLRNEGQRILIVETSGTADFGSTRNFYEKLGYTKEATIRDFWAEGDDKVIYWKKLLP